LSTTPTGTINTSHTVARNSFWYGLELLFSVIGAFFTSVMVARVVGPEQLGHFSYIFMLTNYTAALAQFGLPGTIKKYMAEYLGRGEPDVAHAIYRAALWIQILLSAGITVVAMLIVMWKTDPAYRLMAVLLISSIAPRLIGSVPSQANNAAERLKRNTVPALISAVFNIGFTLFSLWIGWGLAGVAIAYAGAAVIDTFLKLIGVHQMLGPVPPGTLSPELKRRMFAYSGQGIALMLLNLTVWDKSDVIILGAMNPDIKQVTFFTIAFNIVDRLLTIPNTFAGSLNVTIMAQYDRGVERLRELTVTGAKYAFLLAVPILVGMACISPVVVRLYSGKFDYSPMITVLAIVATLGISKAMISPPTALLQATENQGTLIWIGCICGGFDILLDFLLTPTYGAIGAAVANGLAQTAAAAAMWWRVRQLFGAGLRLGELGRIALSGAVMAAMVVLIVRAMGGLPGVALGVLAGALTWFVMLRLTRALHRHDGDRLRNLSRVVPAPARPLYTGVVNWIAAAE